MHDIIASETNRLEAIKAAIDDYAVDRQSQLKLHDSHLGTLKEERLASVDWKEKDDLSEKMVEHEKFNPRKYLIPFENHDSPYFGVVGIQDDDKKIGAREYLLGKQSLIVKNKVQIVDWRKAEVSRFYYDWQEGDEYDEEIQGRERTGTILCKRTITISQKNLVAIDTVSARYHLVNGQWVDSSNRSQDTPISAEIKSATGNHHLIDIVALISPEQFATITRQHKGCVYITGRAGSGKTVVATHRASYLQFNHPELFRPERCLFIVFNKTLQGYVRKSARELLGNTAIETYSAWAKTALSAMDCHDFTLSTAEDISLYDHIKKRSETADLLERYVAKSAGIAAIRDLFRFYQSTSFAKVFFTDKTEMDSYLRWARTTYLPDSPNPVISFADLGPLLRLCQLRSKREEVPKAKGYYQHCIVDESQDLSLTELETIFAAVDHNKSMTVCADPGQNILSFIDPTGIERFKEKLQGVGLSRNTLEVGYRSAPEIMAIADSVAGRAHKPLPHGHGPVVSVIEIRGMADHKVNATREVIAKINEYQQADPLSLTAVICKSKAECLYLREEIARNANHGLQNLHPAGQILFTPGVVIINTHQVKGLEFTNVILFNPSGKSYRKTDQDRNLLYVAISRACKRLAIIYWGKLSSHFEHSVPS